MNKITQKRMSGQRTIFVRIPAELYIAVKHQTINRNESLITYVSRALMNQLANECLEEKIKI